MMNFRVHEVSITYIVPSSHWFICLGVLVLWGKGVSDGTLFHVTLPYLLHSLVITQSMRSASATEKDYESESTNSEY